jgi:hypothetical protein
MKNLFRSSWILLSSFAALCFGVPYLCARNKQPDGRLVKVSAARNKGNDSIWAIAR